LAGVALACVCLGGCAHTWDEITSRDFKFKEIFVKQDPLVVLRDSKDGDRRAKAYAALKEPLRSGGTQQDQDFLVEVLAAAAKTEPQFYPRLVAVHKLGEFKDPRVVGALVDAYYSASAFPPESASLLRCQCLLALGQVGHPAGVELLVRVLRQGPMEGPEEDRRRAFDERIAAARALGRFRQYQATEALVGVLSTDKDVALRKCAHESLQACTGKKLPPDYLAWEEFLHRQGTDSESLAGAKKKGVLELIQTGFGTKP
jgi:HEAT repeat protein